MTGSLKLLVGLAALSLAGCATPTGPPPSEPSAGAPGERVTPRPDLQAVFDSAGAVGVFVGYDPATGETIASDPERAARRFVPASTFKLFNALVALETGAVPSVDTTLPWDGVERSVAAWNRDHSLASGMRVSAVWFYQEMARRAGHDALQDAVRAADYGNADIGPPDSLTTFWLTGPLAISAVEQTRFLERLRTGALPFPDSLQAAVRGIAVDETGADFTLWGKSGWSTAATPGVGWYVGWVVRDGAPFVFATQLAVRSPEDVPLRRGLTLQILRRLGWLPPVAASPD